MGQSGKVKWDRQIRRERGDIGSGSEPLTQTFDLHQSTDGI
jgi:hypothetical protein